MTECSQADGECEVLEEKKGCEDSEGMFGGVCERPGE